LQNQIAKSADSSEKNKMSALVNEINNHIVTLNRRVSNILQYIEVCTVNKIPDHPNILENVLFKVANNGQSSSILDFGLHSQFHPHVHYIGSFECETQLLKNILPKYNIDYNFLNFDIQGAELKALKGMEEYLYKVDYLYTEINSDQVYKGCALINELDDYLKQFGLIRVETNWTEFRWGDAFYIRNSLLNN
jgi:FkbM family methyltransferase